MILPKNHQINENKAWRIFWHIPRIFRQLGIPSHAIMILQNGTYSDLCLHHLRSFGHFVVPSNGSLQISIYVFQIFNSIYQRKEEFRVNLIKKSKTVLYKIELWNWEIQFSINFGIFHIHIFLIRYDTELLFLETCDSYVLKVRKFQKEIFVSS